MAWLKYDLPVYEHRRKKILENSQKHTDLFVIYATPVYPSNADAIHPYIPDSQILYTSGLEDPHSAVMFWRESDGKVRTRIFVRKKDSLRDLWEGLSFDLSKAKSLFRGSSVDCDDIENLHSCVLKWLRSRKHGSLPNIYTNAFTHMPHLQKLQSFITDHPVNLRSGVMNINSLQDCQAVINELRLVKDKHELNDLRKSSQINVEAHKALLKNLKGFQYEHEVHAFIEYQFRLRGATGVAYESICASGSNATVLHYIKNDQKIKKKELFLIDAGCRYNHYTSDITRTYPANVKFTQAQADLYPISLRLFSRGG